MVNIDHLRRCQEQRLIPVIASLEEAKKHLEEAIALAEAKELEFRDVSADVQRNLDALLRVAGMARGAAGAVSSSDIDGALAETGRSLLKVAENTARESHGETEPQMSDAGVAGLLRRSSRPLFASLRKTA